MQQITTYRNSKNLNCLSYFNLKAWVKPNVIKHYPARSLFIKCYWRDKVVCFKWISLNKINSDNTVTIFMKKTVVNRAKFLYTYFQQYHCFWCTKFDPSLLILYWKLKHTCISSNILKRIYVRCCSYLCQMNHLCLVILCKF